MPLSREPVEVPFGTAGLGQARAWVEQVCHEMGSPELVESAVLGVSEILSNAVLHARPPITLSLRGTTSHPRFEVGDHSATPPELPDLDPPEDDLLLTFGRGLSMVAKVSVAWGADVVGDRKVVWFVPRDEPTDDEGVQGVISIDLPLPPPRRGVRKDVRSLVVRSVPLQIFRDAELHLRGLRRELRLLAIAHETTYPLAADLSLFLAEVGRALRSESRRQIEAAFTTGADLIDFEFQLPAAAGPEIAKFLALLTLADEFCRQERLLSLARSPEQVEFQEWFGNQCLLQLAGEPSMPWPGASVSASPSA